MDSELYRFPGVVLVTGAGGTGIGAAIARAFAVSRCPYISITDINQDTLDKTHEAILALNPDAQVLSVAGDISDETFTKSLIEAIADKFSRLDYLINCAGILGPSSRTHETPSSTFDAINNVNYRGSWLCSRSALAVMVKQPFLPEHPKQRGAIVNVASQLGIVGRPTAAVYCATKAAIMSLSRCDAIDYSRDGIRVNCVCPGVIETPLTTGSQALVERLRPAIDIAPMRRMGTPEEVADAVLFLCSNQASFIQGHALVVDGGYTIN